MSFPLHHSTNRTAAGRPLRSLGVAAAAMVVLGAGCSDKTNQQLEDAGRSIATTAEQAGKSVATDAGGAIDQGAARTQAEALRTAIKADARSGEQSHRTVVIIQDAMKTVPGEMVVGGLTDADGDGLDDDGKVTIDVNGRTACLTLPATGSDTSVDNAACA